VWVIHYTVLQNCVKYSQVRLEPRSPYPSVAGGVYDLGY